MNRFLAQILRIFRTAVSALSQTGDRISGTIRSDLEMKLTGNMVGSTFGNNLYSYRRISERKGLWMWSQRFGVDGYRRNFLTVGTEIANEGPGTVNIDGSDVVSNKYFANFVSVNAFNRNKMIFSTAYRSSRTSRPRSASVCG